MHFDRHSIHTVTAGAESWCRQSVSQCPQFRSPYLHIVSLALQHRVLRWFHHHRALLLNDVVDGFGCVFVFFSLLLLCFYAIRRQPASSDRLHLSPRNCRTHYTLPEGATALTTKLFSRITGKTHTATLAVRAVSIRGHPPRLDSTPTSN